MVIFLHMRFSKQFDNWFHNRNFVISVLGHIIERKEEDLPQQYFFFASCKQCLFATVFFVVCVPIERERNRETERKKERKRDLFQMSKGHCSRNLQTAEHNLSHPCTYNFFTGNLELDAGSRCLSPVSPTQSVMLANPEEHDYPLPRK